MKQVAKHQEAKRQAAKDQWSQEPAFIQYLNKTVDFGIAGVLFVAPLAMAGRYPPGRLLLALLVGVTAIAWATARCFSRRERATWFLTGVEWLAAFAILLVALQLLPLTSQMLHRISPTISQLLPLFQESVPVAAADSDVNEVASTWLTWQRVSLAPAATRGGFAMTLVYVMFFFVVLQRVRHQADIELLLKAMAIAGVGMAALGIAQKLFGNGKFLWFLEHPSRDTLTAVKGTFANENHFAHFLALTLGPLIWWLISIQHVQTEPQKRFRFGSDAANRSIDVEYLLVCMGLGIVMLAGLLSYSRGGLAMMFLAAVSSTAMLLYQKRVGRNAIISVSVAAAIAIVAVWIHGQEVLTRELATLGEISIESLDEGAGRRRIWDAVLLAIPDFAVLGSGVGSHRYVYPTFFSSPSGVQYTHAESGYLHLLLEAGGPGLGLALVGIGFCGWWLASAFVRDKPEVSFLAVPLISGVLVSVVHAVFDFNWFIPANMCLTLVIAASSARLFDLSSNHRHKHRHRHRVQMTNAMSTGLVGLAVVMSTLSVNQFVAPALAHSSWNEYLAWSLATNRFSAKSIGPGRQRSLGFVDGNDPSTVNRMIELLDQTLQADPTNGRAHIRKAAMCLRQFEIKQESSENPMTLSHIRDAALASEFASHQQMVDWVSRVVGENRIYLDQIATHCKRGIQLTPTEGRGYLLLSEVAFLDESLKGAERQLLEQAYAVRPYDPGVQFALGRYKMLDGESEVAMELWKDAFRRGPDIRKRIIGAVGFLAPPQEILDVFRPGLDGLRDLFQYYRTENFPPQMEYVGARFVEELERQAQLMSGATAGELWFEAQFVHATLGHVDQAVEAARNAVYSQQSEIRNHEALALRLRDAGQFDEAVKEFRWCRDMQPENDRWKQAITQMQTARQSKRISVRQAEDKKINR